MDDLRPQVWTSPSTCHGGGGGGSIPYLQALERLASVAVKQKALLGKRQKRTRVESLSKTSQPHTSNGNSCKSIHEEVSVVAASGRVCVYDVLSPCSTPAADTSAMDGFAVASALTTNASSEDPVRFFVAGTIAAGADFRNNRNFGVSSNPPRVSDHPCVEIMTGAWFPERQFPQLDAVVKVEDVDLVEDWTLDGESIVKYILVSSPVKGRQHRRPAGSDFGFGDLIVAQGTKIEPKHVMALASVGVGRISVRADSTLEIRTDGPETYSALNVGILPTGSELLNVLDMTKNDSMNKVHRQRIPDSNGPYIASAVRSPSSQVEVDYIGPCSDDEDSLAQALSKIIDLQQYDVLVTSGGLSMGRFDLVRKVVESRFDAEIVFHGCLIRPGAPVLFGVIYHRGHDIDGKRHGMTTLIGAPGNPLAAAMTVRFFLKPFLNMIQAPQSMSADELIQMTLSESLRVQVGIPTQSRERKKSVKAVAFLLARYQETSDTSRQAHLLADVLEDQASYKTKPFLQADCWIAVPAGSDRVVSGDHGQSYSLW